MSPEDARRILASAAEEAGAPLRDAAPGVLAAIAQRRAPADRWLPAAAAVSVVLAVGMGIVAARAWNSLDNPLSPLSPAPQLAEAP